MLIYYVIDIDKTCCLLISQDISISIITKGQLAD